MFLGVSTLLFPSSSHKEWAICEGKENGELIQSVVIFERECQCCYRRCHLVAMPSLGHTQLKKLR